MKKAIAFLLALSMTLALCGCSSSDYKKAQSLFEEGKYDDAIVLFEQLADYKDSAEMLKKCVYQKATLLFNEKEYSQALSIFESLGDYEDSQAMIIDCKYQLALSSYEGKDYNTALALFKEIEGEKNVSNYIQNCVFRSATIGGTVLLGSYEQDADPTNGKEPVEWVVLAKEEDRMLVISLYGLDVRQFDSHTFYKDSTGHYPVCWSNSEMREWINNTLFNDLFSDDEKTNVLITKNDNGDYSDFSINTFSHELEKYPNGYEDSPEDRMFLLSEEEAEKYFSSPSSRCALPTRQAIINGAYHDDNDEGYCCWWLRDTLIEDDQKRDMSYRLIDTEYKQSAAVVKANGQTGGRYNGYKDKHWTSMPAYFYQEDICIRPAMWLDITIIP